ncbi:MAG TPA: TIGR03118 family protein [Gemmatimonadales bacterium]
MFRRWSFPVARAASAALIALALACSDSTGPSLPGFKVSFLVADTTGLGATAVDTNLVNPWGLAFSGGGTLWASDNHSGKSTLYHSDGTIVSTVVAIPSSDSATGGEPTGVIFNGTNTFKIGDAGKALFIFAGEDGTISAWNQTTVDAKLVANRSANGAVYKGLAPAANAGANLLFATNFKANTVDVFDSTFTFVKAFTDPGVPAGFAPFGIASVGGQLYVTFARQKGPDNTDDLAGDGNGYIDVFNPDGTLVKRFASQGSLNSPWGIVQAPSGFGALAGDILVGNFGNGLISAFNVSGELVGTVGDSTGAPIMLDGLWALTVAPGNTSAIFFSAGPNSESHGVLGTITPAPMPPAPPARVVAK